MEIEKSHWACQVVHLMLIKFLLSMRNDNLLRNNKVSSIGHLQGMPWAPSGYA